MTKPLTIKKFIAKYKNKLNIYGQYIDIYNKVTYVIINDSNIKYLIPVKPSMIENNINIFEDLDEFKIELNKLKEYYEKFKDDSQFKIQGQVVTNEKSIAIILNNGLLVPIVLSKPDSNLKIIEYNYLSELDSAIFYGSTRDGIIQTKNIKRLYMNISHFK